MLKWLNLDLLGVFELSVKFGWQSDFFEISELVIDVPLTQSDNSLPRLLVNPFNHKP